MCAISVTNTNIWNAQIIVTDFKQVSWTLICHWPDIQIAPPPHAQHWLSQRGYIKLNIKMIQKEEKITRGKQAEHQHKNIIRHECRCRCQWWGRWINALFLLRDQICLFSLVSMLFAAELWRKREKPEKELKQRMRDDSLRGEDEHIRQELPGNNWVTLWWSATIISKCSRGRQSNQSDLINIKTALVFWCTRMHVIVWQRWCYLTCHLAWLKTK